MLQTLLTFIGSLASTAEFIVIKLIDANHQLENHQLINHQPSTINLKTIN